MGKIIFRYGTMGSSKSAHLLMTGYNFEENGLSVLYIKPSMDTRDMSIRSRIGLSHTCYIIGPDEIDMIALYEKQLKEKGVEHIDVILIDEAQFLTEAQVEGLVALVDQYNKMVICYGLRTDASSHLFEGSRRLFELADKIEEIKSTCQCGHKTIINARLNPWNPNKFISPTQQIVIGGNETYKSVCRNCWKENLSEQFFLTDDYTKL